MPGHRDAPATYSAAFRIYGPISPDTITAKLGVTPTQVQRAGEPRPIRGHWSENMWGLDSAIQRRDCLDKHIMDLCRRLHASKRKIRSLVPRCKIVFWCACFTSTPETTVELTAATMAAMASYKAEFDLSTYASAEK